MDAGKSSGFILFVLLILVVACIIGIAGCGFVQTAWLTHVGAQSPQPVPTPAAPAAPAATAVPYPYPFPPYPPQPAVLPLGARLTG